MNREDAEEYTQALALVGKGWWRQIALAQRLGVPDQLGFASTREWVEQRLGHYPKIPIEERREAAKELTADAPDGTPGMSNRQAAEVLGVDEGTIRNDKRAENSAPPSKGRRSEPTMELPSAENSAVIETRVRDQTDFEREAQRESERRASRDVLRRVLTILAHPMTVPPQKLADQYADIIGEFDHAEIEFAAATMAAIAALPERQDQ